MGEGNVFTGVCHCPHLGQYYKSFLENLKVCWTRIHSSRQGGGGLQTFSQNVQVFGRLTIVFRVNKNPPRSTSQNLWFYFYRPPTKLLGGNVFTGGSLSFCLESGGGWVPM